jgi:hypothetical protein
MGDGPLDLIFARLTEIVDEQDDVEYLPVSDGLDIRQLRLMDGNTMSSSIVSLTMVMLARAGLSTPCK